MHGGRLRRQRRCGPQVKTPEMNAYRPARLPEAPGSGAGCTITELLPAPRLPQTLRRECASSEGSEAGCGGESLKSNISQACSVAVTDDLAHSGR